VEFRLYQAKKQDTYHPAPARLKHLSTFFVSTQYTDGKSAKTSATRQCQEEIMLCKMGKFLLEANSLRHDYGSRYYGPEAHAFVERRIQVDALNGDADSAGARQRAEVII